jgi:hypothetical protein
LDDQTILKLSLLGTELTKVSKVNYRSEILDKIDEAVTAWIADRLEIEQEKFCWRLQEYVNEMRISRKRTLRKDHLPKRH